MVHGIAAEFLDAGCLITRKQQPADQTVEVDITVKGADGRHYLGTFVRFEMNAARMVAQDVIEDAPQAVDVWDTTQAVGVAVVVVIDDARGRLVVLGRVRE